MSKGSTHDKFSFFLIPIIILIAILMLEFTQLNKLLFVCLVVGFYIIGFLFFSPDLDLKGNSYYRWRFLRFIWIPYQKVIPHRSILSHGIFIGTMLRIFYLFFIGNIFTSFLYFLFTNKNNLSLFSECFFKINSSFFNYISIYKEVSISIFIGLELAAIYHIFMDVSSSFIKLKKIKPKKIFKKIFK